MALPWILGGAAVLIGGAVIAALNDDDSSNNSNQDSNENNDELEKKIKANKERLKKSENYKKRNYIKEQIFKDIKNTGKELGLELEDIIDTLDLFLLKEGMITRRNVSGQDYFLKAENIDLNELVNLDENLDEQIVSSDLELWEDDIPNLIQVIKVFQSIYGITIRPNEEYIKAFDDIKKIDDAIADLDAAIIFLEDKLS